MYQIYLQFNGETLTRSCSGDKDLELGSVYASELDISLFTSVDRYTLYGGSIPPAEPVMIFQVGQKG